MQAHSARGVVRAKCTDLLPVSTGGVRSLAGELLFVNKGCDTTWLKGCVKYDGLMSLGLLSGGCCVDYRVFPTTDVLGYFNS